MRKNILILATFMIVILWSCAVTKKHFNESQTHVKEMVDNRDYHLSISWNFEGMTEKQGDMSEMGSIHVYRDSLNSNLWYDYEGYGQNIPSKFLQNRGNQFYKILNYQQKNLPKGKAEVTFSIMAYNWKKEKHEPISFRLIFDYTHRVPVYINGKFHQGIFTEL